MNATPFGAPKVFVEQFVALCALMRHARVLSTMAPPVNPRTALDKILKRERWHGRGGSWVADAIYGANDGLGAVFGIVSGVAGATNNQQHYVLISGLAGMAIAIARRRSRYGSPPYKKI